MGTAGRLVGLAVVLTLGCTFESSGSNDSNMLGSSAGDTDTSSSAGGPMGTDSAGSDGAEGETSFGGSTSVGSDESCIDACVPSVPAGWLGPFYVADADTPIECPNGYNEQDVAFSGLEAPEATCTCSCDATPGNCQVDVLLTTLGCVVGLGLNITLDDGDCSSFEAFGVDVYARATMSGSPTSCAPNLQEVVPPAAWETASTFCAAPARGGDCGDERCTTPPPEGVATRLCISMDGDHPCPDGGYGERRLLHRSFDDQRSCQDCNCAGDPACTGQAFAHDEGDCSDAAQPLAFNVCEDIDVSGTYAVSASIEQGSCTASEATAAGEATPSDAVTVCCAE